MHPSGGSANIYVENEPMLKMLLDNNLALLVFTKKSWAGWSDEDAAKMLNVTLPAVGKIEGIDVRRPILMGFSAGGQLSLSLYQDNVGKFGGLVLDAAYPGIQTISPDNPRQIKTLPMKLKKSDALKGTPILAYVGKLDGGAAIWKQAEPKWLELGVPLTVVYVPEARHQWMLDAKHPAEREILADWLAKVAKGQTPTSQPASQPTTAPVPVATPQREE